MNYQHDTLAGATAMREVRGGRVASVNVRRRDIEAIFGPASIVNHGDDWADGKIKFLWAILIEDEVKIEIWDYKTSRSVDRYNTLRWSVGGSKFALRLLSEITGWEIGK